jgi:GT2 family glycosyltransferase
MPLVPQTLAFYEREFFSSFNGCDRRFVTSYGDHDLYLRAMKKGAYCVFCDDIWNRHINGKKTKQYLAESGHGTADRSLLFDLWIENGEFVDRTSHHESFVYDDAIYTVIQGNTSWVFSR